MNRLILLFVLVVLTGCNSGEIKKLFTPDPVTVALPRGIRGSYGHLVRVETHEPGAKVEINKGYVGTTPCTIVVYGDRKRTFRGNMDTTISVYPSPTASNQFMQTKEFTGGGKGRQKEQIPEALYFDLRIPPGTKPGEEKTLNLNVKDVKEEKKKR